MSEKTKGKAHGKKSPLRALQESGMESNVRIRGDNGSTSSRMKNRNGGKKKCESIRDKKENAENVAEKRRS